MCTHGTHPNGLLGSWTTYLQFGWRSQLYPTVLCAFLPALLNIFRMTPSAELHSGGIHDNVTKRHTDHVVVVDGADTDAIQVGQGHHQLVSAHLAAIGVLPVVLTQK